MIKKSIATLVLSLVCVGAQASTAFNPIVEATRSFRIVKGEACKAVYASVAAYDKPEFDGAERQVAYDKATGEAPLKYRFAYDLNRDLVFLVIRLTEFHGRENIKPFVASDCTLRVRLL